MMAWLALALIALAALALLWLLGFPRALWSFAAAALMLGAAGYALQGSPGLPGSPVAAERQRLEVDDDYVGLRHALFGEFTYSNRFFVTADGLTRAGDTRGPIHVMLSGIAASPDDLALWTGLGLAYVQHDGNQLSPAAQFAFDRAIGLNPRHPGPWFFLGMAHIRASDFAGARPLWAHALALCPEGASYRTPIAERLALLDRYLEMQAAEQAPGQ